MTSTDNIEFSKETLEYARKIVARYPEGKQKSALIPLLHLAQVEFGGWLSAKSMDYVASFLSIEPIEAYEVASFYSMFNLKPVGRCHIEVCHTSSCWLMGAEDVVKHIENKLNIKVGQVTEDGQFSLKTVECLGACGYAPMFQVGDKYHEHLTLEKVDTLLEEFKVTFKDKNSGYF
jgi:NADH-quinone oxidoreductase subunit E